MMHAGIEALFGRNRDGHRSKHIFHFCRPKNEDEQLEKFFSHKPHLQKELLHGSTFAFAAMQGWRASMEDKHQHLLSLDPQRWQSWALFAIFDGHHGMETAKHASKQLVTHLLTVFNHLVDEQTKSGVTFETPIRSSDLNRMLFHAAIKEAYFQLDQDLKKAVKDHSGSVCITCLLSPERIYLINIGDSRAIIFSQTGDVLAHTEDHKPDDPAEQERIYQAGGTITQSSADDVPRVESQLAMTRVLGDFGLNKALVPPMADIIEYPRDGSASFFLLACDGIWDVMSNEDVARFVTQRVSTAPLEQIVSELLDECFRKDSSDNMSVYLVRIDFL